MRIAIKYMKLSHIEYTYGHEVYEFELYIEHAYDHKVYEIEPYIEYTHGYFHTQICVGFENT